MIKQHLAGCIRIQLFEEKLCFLGLVCKKIQPVLEPQRNVGASVRRIKRDEITDLVIDPPVFQPLPRFWV